MWAELSVYLTKKRCAQQPGTFWGLLIGDAHIPLAHGPWPMAVGPRGPIPPPDRCPDRRPPAVRPRGAQALGLAHDRGPWPMAVGPGPISGVFYIFLHF